jgi:hypothetical protein
MTDQPGVPPVLALPPWGQLGRVGMICSLTALGAIAAVFLLRPG